MNQADEYDLKMKLFELINSEVFAINNGCCGEESYWVDGIDEAARNITDFIKENYIAKD